MTRARDMTVGELRELLSGYPDHQLVAPGVEYLDSEGQPVLRVGILMGAKLMQSSGLTFEPSPVGSTPVLVIGEVG